MRTEVWQPSSNMRLSVWFTAFSGAILTFLRRRCPGSGISIARPYQTTSASSRPKIFGSWRERGIQPLIRCDPSPRHLTSDTPPDKPMTPTCQPVGKATSNSEFKGLRVTVQIPEILIPQNFDPWRPEAEYVCTTLGLPSFSNRTEHLVEDRLRCQLKPELFDQRA